MKPAGAHRILVERGELPSWLMLPGMSEEQAAPAIVRFSADDGVTVLLLDAPKGWPTELGDRGELIVHGVTVDGGHLFTVLGARVNRLGKFDQARSMRATTLALGAHFDRTTTWSSASFGTAHLYEWAGETGLRVTDQEHSEDGQLRRLAHEWTPPPAHVIEREEARLTVGPVMQTTFTHGPEQRVVTSTRLGVRTAQPRHSMCSNAATPALYSRSVPSPPTVRTQSFMSPSATRNAASRRSSSGRAGPSNRAIGDRTTAFCSAPSRSTTSHACTAVGWSYGMRPASKSPPS